MSTKKFGAKLLGAAGIVNKDRRVIPNTRSWNGETLAGVAVCAIRRPSKNPIKNPRLPIEVVSRGTNEPAVCRDEWKKRLRLIASLCGQHERLGGDHLPIIHPRFFPGKGEFYPSVRCEGRD
jgi:hypothetical protein